MSESENEEINAVSDEEETSNEKKQMKNLEIDEEQEEGEEKEEQADEGEKRRMMKKMMKLKKTKKMMTKKMTKKMKKKKKKEEEEEEEEKEEKEKEKSKKKVIDFKKSKKKLTLSSSNYNVDDELFTEYQDFEKIDENMKKSYIESYHPELIHKNYDEMMKLTFLQRDNKGIIRDQTHKTIPFLTKYEKTKILGLRVKQLNSGAKPFINLNDIFKTQVVLDTNLIAERELELKKLPFIIARPITNKHTEYWNLKDLELI